jgi:hypothetical protein
MGLIAGVGAADAAYDSERSLLRVIHDQLLSSNPSDGQKSKELDYLGQHVQNTPPPIPGNKPSLPTRREVIAKPIVQDSGRSGGRRGDDWNANKFHRLGDVVNYQGGVYKCITAHQGQVDWTPGAAVSLWAAQ